MVMRTLIMYVVIYSVHSTEVDSLGDKCFCGLVLFRIGVTVCGLQLVFQHRL